MGPQEKQGWNCRLSCREARCTNVVPQESAAPDLHGAELWPTHGAEVRGLGGLLRQRRVVEQPRRHRVQRQVELVVPAPIRKHSIYIRRYS